MAFRGDRLSEALNERRISGARLAAALTERGISTSRAYISQLKTGERDNPTVEVVQAVADALRVPVGWLLGDEVINPFEAIASERLRQMAFPRDRSPMGELGPEVREALGTWLGLLRAASGRSLLDAAEDLGVSQAVIVDLESGGDAFAQLSPADVGDLLSLYGVANLYQRRHILALAVGQRGPDRFDAAKIPLAAAYSYALEDQASGIQTYRPLLIPPLLQTDAYAEAALRAAWNSQLAPGLLNRAGELVRLRKECLEKPDRPTLRAIIDEVAFHSPPAYLSRANLIHQIDSLVAACKHAHIALHIKRLGATPLVVGHEGFTVLRFDDPQQADLVSQHGLIGPIVVDEKSQVELYRSVFDELLLSSCAIEETASLLLKIRSGLAED